MKVTAKQIRGSTPKDVPGSLSTTVCVVFLSNIQAIPEEMAVVFEGVSNTFRYLICSRTEEAETELYTQPSLGVYTSSPVARMRTPPTQRSEFSFSLPWLITPGKVWPPAVSTDPTIDASLAQPYNHLRTKLCSALPTGSFFRLQLLHFSLQESAPILLPDPAWPWNAVFLEGWVLTH